MKVIRRLAENVDTSMLGHGNAALWQGSNLSQKKNGSHVLGPCWTSLNHSDKSLTSTRVDPQVSSLLSNRQSKTLYNVQGINTMWMFFSL